MKICGVYLERCYAGWLGKIAGVRFGAPIEGWEYERIRRVLGDAVYSYIVDYSEFAADDDTNGPMFFLRALEDYPCSEELTVLAVRVSRDHPPASRPETSQPFPLEAPRQSALQ